MKIKYMFPGLQNEDEVIARFGRARLIKTPERRYELRGGSGEDHAQAKEWISLFMHEAVLFGGLAAAAAAEPVRR
jgi:hypothetical protein